MAVFLVFNMLVSWIPTSVNTTFCLIIIKIYFIIIFPLVSIFVSVCVRVILVDIHITLILKISYLIVFSKDNLFHLKSLLYLSFCYFFPSVVLIFFVFFCCIFNFWKTMFFLKLFFICFSLLSVFLSVIFDLLKF